MRSILSDDCLPESETCVDQSVSIEGKFIFFIHPFRYFPLVYRVGPLWENTLYNKTSSYICYFKDFEIHIWCVFIYSLNTPNNWGSKAFEAQCKLLFCDFIQRYPMKFWWRSWNTFLWGRLWAHCAEFLKDGWGYATQIVCGRLSPLMSGWSRKLINTQWQQ